MKHFFAVYKTLEQKETVINDTKGAIASVDIIDDAIRRYKEKFGG